MPNSFEVEGTVRKKSQSFVIGNWVILLSITYTVLPQAEDRGNTRLNAYGMIVF
jgi:hypothetical protein